MVTQMSLLGRSIVYWLGFVLSTVLYSLISPIQYLFSDHTNSRIIRSWGTFNLWWLRVTCKISYQVWGADNIPSNQAVVILANHQSTLETILFPQIFPRMTWVLKQELLRIPFFGWGLRHTRPIAIDREEARAALAQVKQQGQQRLDDGISVVIFPEGTRIEPDQHVEYKPGGALLAAGTGYPALPVAHNTGYFWPRHRFIKRPGIVTVSIGPLIPSQGVKAKSINEQAEQWIEAERQRLPH